MVPMIWWLAYPIFVMCYGVLFSLFLVYVVAPRMEKWANQAKQEVTCLFIQWGASKTTAENAVKRLTPDQISKIRSQ